MSTKANRDRRVAELRELDNGTSILDVDDREWTKDGDMWRSGNLTETTVGLVNAGEPLTLAGGGER